MLFFYFAQPERTFRSTAGYYVNTFQRDEATKLFVLETVSTPRVPGTIWPLFSPDGLDQSD
jgi:hypothetical protein